jgi:hypothetical protein
MSREIESSRTMIAAAPGFDLVVLNHGPYALGYIPIVAWEIDMPDDSAL